jgi:hypothetical protein
MPLNDLGYTLFFEFESVEGLDTATGNQPELLGSIMSTK